jgi:hypothetical protein
MPRAVCNLQKKGTSPDGGKVTSIFTVPFGGMSWSIWSAGMLRLWSVPDSFSTSSVSFCPGSPRRNVGAK